MVGYFVDNELRMSGWFERITETKPDQPARKAFVEIARKYYENRQDELGRDWAKYGVRQVGDIANVSGPAPRIPGLAAAWKQAVAERYFSITSAACRKAAPNHLNMGVRCFMAEVPDPNVFRVMGKHCDVVSLNLYLPFPDRLAHQLFTIVPALSTLTGRPLMTTEFSYRGGDTRCPCTLGAPPTVPTQTQRAVGYTSYISAVASLPCFVGAVWFCHNDQGDDVRWVGWAEDCNYGVVDRRNRPHAALTETMRLVNGSIYEIARDPVRNKDCRVFWRTELARWDIDWMDRMWRDLLGIEPPPDPLAAMLPARRRYHEAYWVKFRSPSLTINHDGIIGFQEGNIIRARDGGLELTLFGARGHVSLPRRFWLGRGCSNPDGAFVLESNTEFLHRVVDGQGRLRLLKLVDGSIVKTSLDTIEFRTSVKVPYVEAVYDADKKEVKLEIRGDANRLGIRGVEGWNVTWNGAPASVADPKKYPAPKGLTVFLKPK
jgi:hypothetical protein